MLKENMTTVFHKSFTGQKYFRSTLTYLMRKAMLFKAVSQHVT